MLAPIRKETQKPHRKGQTVGDKGLKTLPNTTVPEASTPVADSFEATLNQEHLKTAPTRTIHPVDSTLDKKAVAKLIGALSSYGDQLIQDPSLKNYARYKSTLQSLLETILPKAYTVIKDYSPASDHHTHKEYHIIGTASQELTSLLSLIKETHQDKIAIVAKVSEIKGMIIDYLK